MIRQRFFLRAFPMRRSVALVALLLAGLQPACRKSTSGVGGDAGPSDGSSPALPDAHVVTPTDSGMGEMVPKPTINGVQPNSGTELGGTRVTIHGTSFVEPADVTLDGIGAGEVVVLDKSSIACTTPPHAPGAVTVKVTTAGGTAELPSGFTYEHELSILAIDPPRIPDVGGVKLTITGRGFNADTIVLIGRKPLAGLTLVDAEHITGWSPALTPGRPEVRALHKDASARRSDLLVVYGTPRPKSIAPGYGPITGRISQTIEGAGFEGAEHVRFGSVSSSVAVVSGQTLTTSSPPLAAGAYDVIVENIDASGTLAGGYIAYDPAATAFAVLGVTPAAASSAGGETVTIVGSGFPPDAVVKIGGVTANRTSAGAHAIQVTVPGALAVGTQDVKVSSVMLGASMTSPVGLRIFAPISITRITPSSGPTSGGTVVTIEGSGFTSGADARIGDIPLTGITVVSPTEITGTTAGGAYGPQDVLVRSADASGVLPGGFTFDEDFEILRIDPDEGSIAGNTYVSVFGRGLKAPVSVKFGTVDGLRPALENGSILGVRTASASPGRVDVAISTGRGDATMAQAFLFYDPRIVTGGAWGGPIEGSVNVAVLDGTGTPIQGMIVQLGYDADIRYARATDRNGLATISYPDLRGPLTITAGQREVEFVTFVDLDARNLTMFASPYPQSMPPDAPVQPCPMGGQPPTVTGRVFGVKSSLDPVTSPGFQPIVRVTYSQPNVFQSNPPLPAEQEFDFFAQEGGMYQIVVMRAGTVAVYAILGDFNSSTQQFIPRRLGIARQVPVAAGQTTENIDINIDIELDKDLTVRLAQPPQQIPGPTLDAVFPFLNLRSEGVIGFDPTAVAGDSVTLHRMPSIAASDFFYMGGSFTESMGSLGTPFSLSLVESGTPFDQGLDMGPFLQMPTNPDPKAADLVQHRTLSWEQGGIKPDITTISVIDIKVVSGSCCVDLNMDGVCEPEDPVMGGSIPQQFTRFTINGPGGLGKYAMPPLPLGIQAFEPPQRVYWEVQQAIAPRFDYREFIYNQLSPFFWTSWSVWVSEFVVKEETD
jgi:IPT/TIG domain-containing protein